MSEKLNAGQFPLLQRGRNLSQFVSHVQSMPQRVSLPSGEIVETGYVKVTGEESIDLYGLCQNDGHSQKLSIKALAYIDEGDNLRDLPITKLSPVNLQDPAYGKVGKAKIVIGYVTKVCGLRWGFELTLDPLTGQCSIHTDRDSPIVGVKLQFD